LLLLTGIPLLWGPWQALMLRRTLEQGRTEAMPRTPAPRRRRGRQKPAEEELADGLPWPGFRRQQALLSQLPEGEAEAAEHRAQVLVGQGWGPLRDWLEHPGQHPGEQPAAAGRNTAADPLAALFDAA
jgi:hypothetical protein